MGKEKFLGSILGILSAVTFGFIPLLANLAYKEGMQVNSLLFLRFGIGAMILWMYIIIKKIPTQISKYQFKHIILISLLGYTLASSTFFYAFKYISSSLSTIIYYCYPVIVVAYEIIKSKKYDLRKISCLFITMLGLLLIVGVGGKHVELNYKGILLAIGSAFSYAYFCIKAGEKTIKEINSTLLSAYVMTICSLFYSFQCIVYKESIVPPNTTSYIYIIVLAIVCGILPILTLALSIKMIGASSASIIGALEPLFVCVLGVMFLNEVLTKNMIIGGSMIIVSVIMLQIEKKEKILNTKV